MALQFGDQAKSYLSKLVSSSQNDFKAFAYQAIDIDSSVKRLTVPAGARYAQLVLESDSLVAAARFLRNTSIAVSSTVGLPLYNGTAIDVTDFANLNGFQITETVAAATTLHVEYFK